MAFKDIRELLRKLWHFIWEDNSIWSWIFNIVLAFVLIKFVLYPVLGFAIGTTHPIVAVVSSSMEHHESFDDWWAHNGNYYLGYNITREDFEGFILKNGFNKGDIIILRGAKPEKITVGDVIVFKSPRPDPIIHRVIRVWKEGDKYFFRTKGDNNPESGSSPSLDETRISEDQVIGKAFIRIPVLGYVKILFVEYMCPLPGISQLGGFLGFCPKSV